MILPTRSFRRSAVPPESAGSLSASSTEACGWREPGPGLCRQVCSSADSVSPLLGSLEIGVNLAQTTFWPSSATNLNAARKSSRPFSTPGGVPSRRRRGTAVKLLSATADAPSGAPADPGWFSSLSLGGGSRPHSLLRVRTVRTGPRGRHARTVHYYISSRSVAIGEARGARTIPSCRMRKDHASAVTGILHRAALNLMQTLQQNCQD